MGVNAIFFLLFPAAETAAAEAAVEEAAGGGDVSFVLLLPTADACAEASKKDKYNGDDECSRADVTFRLRANETRRTGPWFAKSDDVLLRDAAQP